MNYEPVMKSPPCGWCGLKYEQDGNATTAVTVTTLRVVWIEIGLTVYALIITSSPPCGWCGLKLLGKGITNRRGEVTTLRVVWIEIKLQSYFDAYGYVTTLRVVWIEIFCQSHKQLVLTSPPCGWCGLK